ncbi:antitoxin VapB family protein [Candidatus Pacearchaeota archaeon]|nr:antitoxin VapB family protein [Candidatus Pacearchaeota archaeon]
MGSTNISLKKEAYEFLKSLKDKNKSFSDVVMELKEKDGKRGSKENLMKYFGALKDKKDWNETEKRMKEFRDEFEEHVESTIKYMEKARKEK